MVGLDGKIFRNAGLAGKVLYHKPQGFIRVQFGKEDE
jgi:hypothetical protein